MNGKKARNLRNIIKESLGTLPERKYEAKQHSPKLVPNGHINPDGTPSYNTVVPETIELVGCQRKAYRKAKTLHHKFTH